MPVTNTSALSSPPLLHPQTLRLSYLPPVDGLLQQHHHVLTLTAGRLEAFRPLQEDALKITHGREVDIREGLLAHSLVVNLTGYQRPFENQPPHPQVILNLFHLLAGPTLHQVLG